MKVFDYEDVQLIPNKCIVNSRSECDTTVTLGKHSFKMPVVPRTCKQLLMKRLRKPLLKMVIFISCIGLMKRRECHLLKMQQKGLITSISVGVKEGEYAFVETLAREGLVPDYVTIDIAHGHSNAVINMIQHLKIFTRNVRYCGQCWNARSRSRIRKRWSRCHQSGDWTRKSMYY